MNSPESFVERKRLIVVGTCIFFIMSILLFQFYRIQVIEGSKWEKKAEEQHYFYVVEPPIRGSFWSNNTVKKGHPESIQKFALDIRKYHLYIDPKSLPDNLKEEICFTLIALASPKNYEKEKFKEQFYKASRSRKLAMWLDERTKDSILVWWYPYAKKNKIASNAVFFITDYQRSHPYGKMLGQVLHTVQAQKDENSLQAKPTGGLELSLNKYLRGKAGKRRLLRSPRHSLETQSTIELPEHGADVYLTINHCLQAIAEEEIERGVINSKAKGGWAVMMDPYTGHILALAQYPYFYPDKYSMYFNRPDLMEHAKIKAVVDAYEPGSTMKPITIAIALKANKERRAQGKKELFHPLEKIDTSSGKFPGRGKKPLTDTHFHHYLNMYLGLQKSSNIYVATLAQRIVQTLGDDWYRKQLEEVFGFGIKTYIELPGESVGKLPTPGKLHPNGRPEWSVPTPYSLAMGHNIQATTLQMLRAYAVFANGGYMIEPTLVRKIVKTNSDGTESVLVDNTTNGHKGKVRKVLDDDIIQEVIRCMKYITKQGGTAPRANIWGYTEAGKTGTSMKVVSGLYSNKQHFPNFLGFAPVNNAAFVLLVGLDEPKVGFIPGIGLNHHAGESAAPVFREIGRRALEYLGIPPDDPYGYPVGDPRRDPAKADWFKEVESAKKLYEEWNGKRH